MPTRIEPGDDLFAVLLAAQQSQGGRLVEHLGTFYRSVVDDGVIAFVEIPERPEKSSLGKADRYHRAPYPPEVE